MLRPADQATVHAPLTVTCGTKQVRTSLESTTFDHSGRSLLSVHLMLALEQQIRPDLTYSPCHPGFGNLPYSWHCFCMLVKRWS